MKYTVIGAPQNSSDIHLKDDAGNRYLVDVFVDASFEGAPEFETMADRNAYCESLIGKQLEIESLHIYSYIACNIRIIEPKPEIV